MSKLYYLLVSAPNNVREDQYQLFHQIGGSKICIGNSGLQNKITKNLILLRDQLRFLLRKFHKDDICLVLLPYTQHFKTFMYLILLLKRIKFIVVAIDLDKFRMDKYNDYLEKRIYRKASAIVAQTKSMKNKMLEYGYATKRNKIYTGNFWSILSDYQFRKDSDCGYTLAFCGNFNKEPFLTKLSELGNDFRFNVYCSNGKGPVEDYGLHLYDSNGIARRLNCIEGDWGLVWEGDRLETCTGHYREYLKMVYSYKASLYIAANIPLIIWSGSEIADFVRDNHLGIVVDNLFDMHEKIASLTKLEKNIIHINVRKWSETIRSGSDRTTLFENIYREI